MDLAEKPKSLEKLVHQILPHHSVEFKPVYPRVELPQRMMQLMLLQDYPHCSLKPVELGTYYEVLSKGFFGGSLTDLYTLQGSNGDDHKIKPDLTAEKRKVMREVKAWSRHSNTSKLQDHQISRYVHLQLSKPNHRINFHYYRHPVRGIRKFKGSRENLYDILSNGTLYSIVLPLSLILVLHDQIDGHNGPLVYRNKNNHDPFPPCTLVRSSALNSFLWSPEETIALTGLDPERFTILRQNSPRNFKIDKKDVKPFPILIIQDNEHQLLIDYILNLHGPGITDFEGTDANFEDESIEGVPF